MPVAGFKLKQSKTTLGLYIQQIRMVCGITQKEFDSRAGLSSKGLCGRIERGGKMSMSDFESFCSAFNIPPDDKENLLRSGFIVKDKAVRINSLRKMTLGQLVKTIVKKYSLNIGVISSDIRGNNYFIPSVINQSDCFKTEREIRKFISYFCPRIIKNIFEKDAEYISLLIKKNSEFELSRLEQGLKLTTKEQAIVSVLRHTKDRSPERLYFLRSLSEEELLQLSSQLSVKPVRSSIQCAMNTRL